MTYSTWRIAPGQTKVNPATIRGRRYSCAAGSFIDIPDFDAEVLVSGYGWVALARNGHPTAERPLHALSSQRIFDSTLGVEIVSDGAGNWLHSGTGVAV